MTIGPQRSPASVRQIEAQTKQLRHLVRDNETTWEGKYGYAAIQCPRCGRHVIVDVQTMRCCEESD